MALRKFAVNLDPEVEDEVFEADTYLFLEDSGVLKLLTDRKAVVIFPAGAWRYFKEVTNGDPAC